MNSSNRKRQSASTLQHNQVIRLNYDVDEKQNECLEESGSKLQAVETRQSEFATLNTSGSLC